MPWHREFSRNEGGCSSCLEHGRCHGLCPYPGAGAGPLGVRFFGVGSKSGCSQRLNFLMFFGHFAGSFCEPVLDDKVFHLVGEVSVSRLVAESKVNASPKTQYIWILSVYICSLVCHSHIYYITPAVYSVQNVDVGIQDHISIKASTVATGQVFQKST